MNSLFERIARAREQQAEVVEETKPRVMRAVVELLQQMITHDIPELSFRLADESGFRHMHVRLEKQDHHKNIRRARFAWQGPAAKPILIIDVFRLEGDDVKLGAATRDIIPKDLFLLANFMEDLQDENRHGSVEVNPDSVSIVLKRLTH